MSDYQVKELSLSNYTCIFQIESGDNFHCLFEKDTVNDQMGMSTSDNGWAIFPIPFYECQGSGWISDVLRRLSTISKYVQVIWLKYKAAW